MMQSRFLLSAVVCVSFGVLSACDHDDARPTPSRPGQVKAKPTPPTQLPDDQPVQETPPPPPTSRPSSDNPPASAQPTPAVDYPYGVPVQGKPGFVTSPYAPDSGYVDVHGFTPGQQVRDPYTQKIFLVP